VRYFVISPDGMKYGPGDIPTLNQWVMEGRLLPSSTLEEETSGVRVQASTVTGLNFPVVAGAPPASGGPAYAGYYPRDPSTVAGPNNGQSLLIGAYVVGVIGLVTCCSGAFSLVAGIGAFALAYQAGRQGHPGAVWAKTLAAVVIIFAITVMALGGVLQSLMNGVGGG